MLQFTLTGRLAADPEFATYGPDNAPMARIRVASNQPGSQATDFFDVAVFGDNAVAALRDANKGDKVQLKGNGRQNVWTTDTGERREGVSLAARTVEHTPRIDQSAQATSVESTRSATATANR